MSGAAQAAAASTVPFDLFIIGGGINGAGIARDAAGRGLRVGLAEAADFAGATSSASTKLIHGGLRYLEHFEFRLVAEALSEREKLLDIAPHIAWPLRFVMPHVPGLRPRWMIRTGLWLYDHLGGKSSLPRSHALRLSPQGPGAGLRPDIRNGFIYSDAWVDDARLVILNLKAAQQKGATILARTRLLQARRHGGLWHCDLLADGQISTVTSRALVNAAGPWVGEVERLVGSHAGSSRHAALRLVRGSHLVLPRLYEGEHAYILQNSDRRIVFMIPYEGRFTLVGTTDVAQDSMAEGASISAAEEQYLLDAINRYLAKPARAADIVWRYAGVRPLYDDESGDPSAVTLDYTLVLDAQEQTPLLSIYGGKITTYRRLAEAALAKLAPHLPHAGQSWTANEALPGGDFARAERAAVLAQLQRSHAGLDPDWIAAAFARHGSTLAALLREVHTAAELGRDFGGGLFEREARWFIENEWAREPDDVLWRRSKYGLHMSAEQRQAFAEWFRQNQQATAAATREQAREQD